MFIDLVLYIFTVSSFVISIICFTVLGTIIGIIFDKGHYAEHRIKDDIYSTIGGFIGCIIGIVLAPKINICIFDL